MRGRGQCDEAGGGSLEGRFDKVRSAEFCMGDSIVSWLEVWCGTTRGSEISVTQCSFPP